MFKKIFISLFCIISILFSQIVPSYLLDDIDTKDIPINIPYISSNSYNILFSDHAISRVNTSGIFSYLKIN